MSDVKIIRADDEGVLEDVHMIALHGHVHPTETPARYAPVYVDGEHCLLRVVEVSTQADGFKVRVEAARPPLPRDGKLPGYATRVGPFHARLDHHVVVLGPSEIERAERLKPRAVLGEPASVESFIHWLLTDRDPSGKLACQRIQGAAVWYCSKAESFALFERIHSVVQDEFFEAARLFRENRPGARARLEEVSFWLSRAATGDQDIYRAAAGLRRAASPDWQIMLREGLQLKNERDWKTGLQQAEELLEKPPAPEQSSPKAGPKLSHCRASMRSRFMSVGTEPPASEKGSAAA